MRAPFVLRVESMADGAALRLADALRPLLAARGARARIEAAPRPLPGTTVSVAVHDPDGHDKWLLPLRVEDEPDRAAAHVMSFLERWGFIGRARRVP